MRLGERTDQAKQSSSERYTEKKINEKMVRNAEKFREKQENVVEERLKYINGKAYTRL